MPAFGCQSGKKEGKTDRQTIEIDRAYWAIEWTDPKFRLTIPKVRQNEIKKEKLGVTLRTDNKKDMSRDRCHQLLPDTEPNGTEPNVPKNAQVCLGCDSFAAINTISIANETLTHSKHSQLNKYSGHYATADK